MKKYIVTHDTVLGVGKFTFKLTKGMPIEVYEKNSYNQVRVKIMGQEVMINGTTLDRIANEQKVVHYVNTGYGIPAPICGDPSTVGGITKNLALVTCEKCLSEFPY